MTTSDTFPQDETRPSHLANLFRFLGWMLLIPLLGILIVGSLVYTQVNSYFVQHEDRIYTGVHVLDVDLSGLTSAEAVAALRVPAEQFGAATVELIDPRTGQVQQKQWAELGVALDVEGMAARAANFGRNRPTDDQAILWAWYRGHTFAPVWKIDESVIGSVVNELGETIDQSVENATVSLANGAIATTSTQTGYQLDRDLLRSQLLGAAQRPLADWQQTVTLELPIAEETPEVASVAVAAEEASVLLSGPLDFFVASPVDSADLQPLQLPIDQIEQWLTLDESGTTIDTEAIRRWLVEIAPTYSRSAERARFYFDDITKELVLIQPHVNGRFLDVDATYQNILAQIHTPNRNVSLVMGDIVPDIHSDVKAADLGITELLSEETTYFYDSFPERKHNIQLGATKFHGLVVLPGEEFSFNDYLGEISYDAGFRDGLVIIGGRTQSGIGGGICQVSTTLFQTVFWSGLAIGARNQHGYRVPYYEMAPGKETKPLGMDAAIYSPIVDFTFTNNSSHHLLIETYYRADDESLTFKFYSTSLGRTVEQDIWVTNERSHEFRNRYTFNPDLEEGEIRQVEWAADGADVLVHRVVWNQWGETRDEDYFQSEYEPWSNVFEYGPNTEIPTLATPVPPTPTPEGGEEGESVEGTPPNEEAPPTDTSESDG